MLWKDRFKWGKQIYHNPLQQKQDVQSFVMEGEGAVSFPLGRMRLDNTMDAEEGQKANIVFWCPEDFPADLAISWDFWPIHEPGLCILFFAAKGQNGEDLFDSSLQQRTGPYNHYHHGDINAYHISYFRRKYESERAFHTCNLRKSYGFHMVAQGADPIASVLDAKGPYKMSLIKAGGEILLAINDLLVIDWKDDGSTYGKILQGGKIGFRQMAPMIGEYANLEVRQISGLSPAEYKKRLEDRIEDTQ